LDRILHAWLRYSVKPGKGSQDKPDRGNHHEAQEKIDQAEHESALKGVRNEHLQFSSVAAPVSLSASTFSTCISFSAFTPVHAGRAVDRLQKRQLEQRSHFLAGPIGADLANAGVGKRQRLRERHSVCPQPQSQYRQDTDGPSGGTTGRAAEAVEFSAGGQFQAHHKAAKLVPP
jgi:hypothetical protein